MRIVDVDQAAADLVSLLHAVETGEDVVITRAGRPLARLSKASHINRTPGVLAQSPAWKEFRYDPSVFSPLGSDEELRAEGWEI